MQKKCKNCICLVEKDKRWYCDQHQDYCKNIKKCGEWD